MKLANEIPKATRILEAAERIFSVYGYERATLDEIITLADVGKGTVYKYFGNKEQLFYKLVTDKNKPFVESLRQVTDAADGFKAKLLAYFREFVRFYYANTALWQIICFEMLGAGKAGLVQRVNGEYHVLSRYSQVSISPELEEQILRYHTLLMEEYHILEDILRTAYKAGALKDTMDIEITGKYLFFGVAMSIFNPTQAVKNNLEPEKAAELIVDRYLYGDMKAL
jgi:AcrR family transcriptional regulator